MKKIGLITLILIVISSCSSSRYLLNDKGKDKKYLISKINEFQKNKLLTEKPTIIIDKVFYKYDILEKNKIKISRKDIYSVNVFPNNYGNISKSVVIITKDYKNTLEKKDKPYEEIVLSDMKDMPNADGRIANAINTITKNYQNYEGEKKKPYEVIVYSDMKEISIREMKTINPEDVAAIDVIKSDSALQRIGHEDYGGVIYITTKGNAVQQYRTIFSKLSDEYSSFIKSIPIEEDLRQISYCINGKIVDSETPEIDILNAGKQNITEITVKTDIEIMQQYNLKDKRGIILLRID